MIKYELIDSVGKITLNRPEKYHSFVREMALQLQDVLDRCKEENEVRAILITATGKAFCAGQDLGEAIGEIDTLYFQLDAGKDVFIIYSRRD